MIKSIKLTNWKTHKDTYLEFQKGNNVIIGLMGAGKSSMMDAISFALFGTFPALEHRRYKVEDIIMNRPERKSSATVELELLLGNDTYKISRTISKAKKNESKLEKNGKYLQTQSERVTEEIESILKINYDVFSRAIYAEQNRLDYFLELRKGERKKQIDEMLGLDRFALAEENSTSLANAIKSLIAEDEKFVQNADIKSMQERLKGLTEELSNAAENEKKHREDSRKMKEQLAAIKQEYQKMKEQNDKRMALAKGIAEIESKISTLKSQLAKIEVQKESLEELAASEHDLSESIKALKNDIESKRAREKECISSLSSYKAELKQSLEAKHKLEEASRQMDGISIKELKESIKSMQDAFNSSISEVSKAEGMLSETRKWLNELNEHEGKCPICERPLSGELKDHITSERQELIRKFEETIKLNKAESEKAKKELEELNSKLTRANKISTQIESYSESASKYEALVQKAEEYEGQASAIKEELASLTSRMDKLSSSLESLHNRMDSIKRAKSLQAEITASENDLKSKNEEIKQISVTDNAIEQVRESYNSINAEYAKNNAELNALIESSSKLKSQIDESTKSISQITAMEEKIGKRRKLHSEISRFKTALITTESQLRLRLVTSINELLEGLWLGLYPYGDYAGIALRAYPDDYALEAAIQMDGEREWMQIEGVASGGERSVACLALRIALSMVIVPNLKWLILDEPTHNIDSQGITKIIEVFSNSLPSIVDQIFIITHDDALKQIHSARIYELDRDKGINGPTTINTE